MAAATRIYVVLTDTKQHLVRATNKVQAINHIARASITAEVASQDELIAAIGEGVKVENAMADAVIDPEQEGQNGV